VLKRCCIISITESQRKVHIIYIIDPSESLPSSILNQLQPDLPAPAPASTSRARPSPPQQPLYNRIPTGPAAGPSSSSNLAANPTPAQRPTNKPTPTGPKKAIKPTPTGPANKKVSAKPVVTGAKSLLSRIDVSLKDRIGGMAPGTSKVANQVGVGGFQDTSSPAYQAA
jgi:hypothetical protein